MKVPLEKKTPHMGANSHVYMIWTSAPCDPKTARNASLIRVQIQAPAPANPRAHTTTHTQKKWPERRHLSPNARRVERRATRKQFTRVYFLRLEAYDKGLFDRAARVLLCSLWKHDDLNAQESR